METKNKLKKWFQNKIKTINVSIIDQLEDRFTFISRAEYLNYFVLNSTIVGISDEKYCTDEIIVSLTTYEKRLYEVYLTIESLMQQTLKPNKIILWLGDNLKNIEIPLVLQNQQKRGLEIRFCKDLRSYKKLIPSLLEFPSACIITADDDCLYNFDFVENFVNAHKKDPNLIYCTRMHRMKLLNNYTLEKYKKWPKCYNYFDVSPFNFPTGIGGILYPPHCFNNEIFNEQIFMNICKYGDDIWFKAMSLLNNYQSQKIYPYTNNGKYNLENERVQDTALNKINVDNGLNDIQLKAVFDKYNLYEKLSNEATH